MDLIRINKTFKIVSLCCTLACVLVACSVSYKFNGASINYDKVKTISFETFPNRSAIFSRPFWFR